MNLQESGQARERPERDAPLDFGARLRQARERQGIPLRQIAITTKISITALEALERDEPSRLPGGIFSRAFVRSYAAEVGLDPEQMVREFVDRFPSESGGVPASSQAPDGPDEEFESRRRIAGTLIGLLLLSLPVAGVVIYYTSFRTPAATSADPVTASVVSRDESAAPPVAQDAVASSPAGVTPDTAAAPNRPGAAPAVPTVASPAPAPPQMAIPPGGLAVALRATGPCWIGVTVDGGRQTSRLMQAGDTQAISVGRQVVLAVGDAAALGISINNAPGRSLGTSGQVVIVTITPENYRTYLLP